MKNVGVVLLDPSADGRQDLFRSALVLRLLRFLLSVHQLNFDLVANNARGTLVGRRPSVSVLSGGISEAPSHFRN